jgi:hypothetical protein
MLDHDSTYPDVLITADSHVGETESLHERLPEHLRRAGNALRTRASSDVLRQAWEFELASPKSRDQP